ncbi:magnesium/cobalt transporter CorA [Dendrosporobacter sp. 1207_IL3150]|uniref:magnesium/cobalt transporter CorA n=1 Tax=Dendrosporobacter sp. 1207_IL3150 TaxID=3084054 RepID=UPI002FDB155E
MRRIRGIAKKRGTLPGSLVYIGEARDEKSTIELVEYDKDTVCESKFLNVNDLVNYQPTLENTWIDVHGIHDVELVGVIGSHYGIHPLVLEDIVNTNQRPKFEDHGVYAYLTVKMLILSSEGFIAEIHQVSFIVGSNYLISFQETDNEIFKTVRNRMLNTSGKLRTLNTDYLAYSLIDAITDNYYYVLESLSEKIEEIEDKVIERPTPDVVKEIHVLKNELLFIRKAIWPLREVIHAVQRGDSKIFTDETRIYIRDIYDHTRQVIDNIEMYRDMASGLLDIYLSSTSNRLSEVTKVLTIISTIFIPLNFIAGVYGMNFQYMPELSWEWGYPAVLSLMALVALSLICFFRKSEWI